MNMPRSVTSTIDGNGYNRQEVAFDQSGGTTVPQNYTNGKTPQNRVIQDPKERLLSLTKAQQPVVRAIRRCPGSDSVTVANAVNLQRHAALAHLKKLADDLDVLKSDKDDPRRGGPGSKKPLHFWLAEDIPAELVDAILGDSSADPDVILANHNRRSRTKSDDNAREENLSPMVVFGALPPLVREVAFAIAEAGSKGIGAPELSRITGQGAGRIYDRANTVVNFKLAEKKLLPGFKKQSVYVPTAELLEVIEQLPPKQTENVQDVWDFDVDTSDDSLMENTSSKATSSQNINETISQLNHQNEELWLIVEEIAEEVRCLKDQYKQIEIAVRGRRTVKADDIRAILRSAPK